MNFYEYYSPEEVLPQPAPYIAAKELIEKGLHVIPLEAGSKEPYVKKSGFVHELRNKPIHHLNAAFYFNRDSVEIGLMLHKSMEVMDIDEKHCTGISDQMIKAVQLGWPELYEKLVISKTPSGGYHFLYQSEIIGGKTKMAERPESPNPVCFIERLNEGNKDYIKISPSKGYKFVQGSPFDIQSLTAEERNWLSAVAMSFNKVHIPEVKKTEASREDSPWFVFNKMNDWKYILDELKKHGWAEVMDYGDRITVKRPGNSEQRSSGSIFKESNVLYLFTSSSEFEDGKPYSAFGVYAKFYHDNNIAVAARTLSAEGIGINKYDEGQFWIRNGKKIEVKYTELLNWLHGIGYRNYNGSFVQVIDNIVEIVDESTFKIAFLNELEPEIKDSFFERVATIFSDKGGLLALIKPLEDNFVWDDKKNTWVFFKNYAIKIDEEKCTPLQYKELPGFIWKTDIIDRPYHNTNYDGCVADRFISILGGDNTANLRKLIGYSISRHKDALNPRAVILMEDIEAEDEGESQGGSGKGLACSFIKHFRKSVDINGKAVNFSDPFIFQNVDVDTSVIFIDDVEKKFPFNKLFSILTGSLPINKKNKPQQIIPFNRSPKIVITSNFNVGSRDNSTQRRKYEFPVVKHFNQDRTPLSEFGHEFFTDWSAEEWSKFDNYIIECCRLYLAEKDKANMSKITENSLERSLVDSTNKEFVEYMDGQKDLDYYDFCPAYFRDGRLVMPDGGLKTGAVNREKVMSAEDKPDNFFLLKKNDLLDKIKVLTSYKNLSTTIVTRWFKDWAKARNIEVDGSYKRANDGTRHYRIFPHFKSEIEKTEVGEDDSKVGEDLEDAPF